MSETNKIVFIHSLNNFTGSPNILSVIIKNFLERGYNVDLITSKGEGFLSNIEDVNYCYTCYRWLDNQWITAILMLLSQIQLFFVILFSRNKGVIYYLNTITPVGAAWACRLTNKNYVYHVHENMSLNKPVYKIFRWTYKYCNRKSVFVSNYLKTTAVNCRNGIVIYNGLDHSFVKKAQKCLANNKDVKKNILMVASLRKFKGIYEFVELSRKMPQYNFELVLSATDDEVRTFIDKAGKVPSNITIYSRQNEMHQFYRRAKLLLQLSHPKTWVETFGLTILEAMVYGIPAIVPNIGGPTELIESGINGYQVDPHNLSGISSKIEHLMQNEKEYEDFSYYALQRAKEFSEQQMVDGIERYITKKSKKDLVQKHVVTMK